MTKPSLSSSYISKCVLPCLRTGHLSASFWLSHLSSRKLGRSSSCQSPCLYSGSITDLLVVWARPQVGGWVRQYWWRCGISQRTLVSPQNRRRSCLWGWRGRAAGSQDSFLEMCTEQPPELRWRQAIYQNERWLQLELLKTNHSRFYPLPKTLTSK